MSKFENCIAEDERSMIKVQIPDFSLRQICDSGQCFRMWEESEGTYSLIAGERFLRMEQKEQEIIFHCTREEYETIWKKYFDLDAEYEQYIKAIELSDQYLQEAAAFGRGIRILRQDIWEMVITFIISQQNNIKRIRKCIETLCEKYGEQKVVADGTAFFSFPTPEALSRVSEEEFRACNLGYRSKYLVKTSHMVAKRQIFLPGLEQLDYFQAKQELMKLPGVGSKVADCICLFGLHELDAFPVDTHILKVLQAHYPKGFPFEIYLGFAGVLQQYIFYYDLMHGK